MFSKPIRYLMLYLAFTLIAYIVTYAKTDSHNMVLTVLVCIIYFLSMYFGYYTNRSIARNDQFIEKFAYTKFIRNILVGACIATIVVSFVNVFSFYSSTQMVLDYISNPGAAYEYVKSIRRNNVAAPGMITISSSLLGITLNTLSFTKYIVIIFIPLFWRQLSKILKIFSIVSLGTYLIQAFLIGAMINIGIIIFSLVPILFFMGGRIRTNVNVLSKLSKFIFAFLLVIAIVLIIFFMGTRYVSVNTSSFGEIMSSGMLGLSFYISHGYVGLSTCFDLPFEPTYGATIFHGLATTFLPQATYNSLWESSYLMRNQMYSGWQSLQVWSTIFPWLASDISFFLVPVVMFFMGRFMGRAWKHAFINKNPYAFLMMSQLMIFAFMIPANNQLFHSYGNSAGTILIYIMYRLSLSKKKISIKFKVS